MATKYIISSLVGAFAFAYAVDRSVFKHKVLGGTTPSTIKNEAWRAETDKKARAWPRTAGPPVALNPITRQNYTVLKANSES